MARPVRMQFYSTLSSLIRTNTSAAPRIGRSSQILLRRMQSTSRHASSYYDLFPETLAAGPPPHGPFQVDANGLRKEFYKLQTRAHPDRFPPQDKARAEGLSARLNEAYRTLTDPLRRSQYLLSLQGIDVAEDETAKVEDPQLLMDVLDARETLEEAREASELESLITTNDQRYAESLRLLEEAFLREDTKLAVREVVKLRYWSNLRQSLKDWEPGKPVKLVH